MSLDKKPVRKNAIQHLVEGHGLGKISLSKEEEEEETPPRRKERTSSSQSRLRAKEENKPMTKKDIDESHFIRKDELIEFLKDNLKLEVIGCGFTDPNGRNIRLWLGEELLSDQYLDVTQKAEYEG